MEGGKKFKHCGLEVTGRGAGTSASERGVGVSNLTSPLFFYKFYALIREEDDV